LIVKIPLSCHKPDTLGGKVIGGNTSNNRKKKMTKDEKEKDHNQSYLSI